MKYWKYNNFICYLLIFILVFIFIACSDDEENEYVENSVILNEGGITVYQGKGVSNSEFDAIVDLLNEVVSSYTLSIEQIFNFKENFPIIYIVKGTGISHKENVLTIGCDETLANLYVYLVIDNNLI